MRYCPKIQEISTPSTCFASPPTKKIEYKKVIGYNLLEKKKIGVCK